MMLLIRANISTAHGAAQCWIVSKVVPLVASAAAAAAMYRSSCSARSTVLLLEEGPILHCARFAPAHKIYCVVCG